ncbi:MAG: TolC family protein [Bacteroidota bacterium]
MPLRLLALPLALLLAAPAVAQGLPPEASGGITLEEAIDLALATSPEVARADLAERGRGLAERGAGTERLPSVNFQAQPSQSYGLTFDQTAGELTSQRVESFNAGVSAQITLYDGGRTRALVDQARLDRASAEASGERTRQTVAADVAERFLQLLLDRQLVEIQTEQLEAARQQLDRAERLVAAGARPESDLPAQRATVAERVSALAQATASVARDRVRLLDRIGLGPLAEVEFIGPALADLEAAGLLGGETPEIEALVEAALAGRLDLRAQSIAVDAAVAGEALARTVSKPNLSAFGQVGTGYSSLQQRFVDPDSPPIQIPVTLPDGSPILLGGEPFVFEQPTLETERTPLFSQLADNRSGSLGLTLSVPLFDRYAARRQREEARLAADNARVELEALERAVATEVGLAAVEISGAEAQLTAAEARVEAAQAAVDAEEARYDLGATTPYDLAAARSRLAEALASRAQSAYTLVFRRALLRLATGDDLSDLL